MADSMRLTVKLQEVAPPGVTVLKDNSDTGFLDSLRPLTGNDFDRAYVRGLGLEAYRRGIVVFEREAEEGENPSLRQAARNALPTLRENYLMGQKLADKLGVVE